MLCPANMHVFVAHPHPLMREGLKRFLAAVPEVKVIREAATEEALQAALRAEPCEMLVVGPTSLSAAGLILLERLREEHPDLVVLALGRPSSPFYARRALRAGADGYLPLEVDRSLFLEAVRAVARGEPFLVPEAAAALARQLGPEAEQPRHVQLSRRELEVMRLIAHGWKAPAIAETLILSASTIRTYRQRVFNKMGFANDAELIRYALEHQLID